MIRISRVRSLWIAIAVLRGVAIAGCGSTAAPSRATADTRSEPHPGLQFSQCVRANGVPNFRDPVTNGNIPFPITSPIPQSAALQSAQNGPCQKYLSR
jgi:hypothetical protein